MHTRIIQLSAKPLEKENFIDIYSLDPEQYDNLADYVCSLEDSYGSEAPAQRKEAIKEFVADLNAFVPESAVLRKNGESFKWNATQEQVSKKVKERLEKALLAVSRTKDAVSWRTRKDVCEAAENPLGTPFYFINGENQFLELSGEMLDYLTEQKPGSVIYVGTVADCHF